MAAQARACHGHTAEYVGNAFTRQYYAMLHQSPGFTHRFYQDTSKLGRPEKNGTMSITTSAQAIHSKILSLNYNEYKCEIKSVDAQDSWNKGISVLVTGSLTGKDNVVRNFMQHFFLAPQERGYFVLNDMFRYTEDANHYDGDNAPSEHVETCIDPKQVIEPKEEPHKEVAVFEDEEVVEDEEEYEIVDEVQEIENLEEFGTRFEKIRKKSSYSKILQDIVTKMKGTKAHLM